MLSFKPRKATAFQEETGTKIRRIAMEMAKKQNLVIEYMLRKLVSGGMQVGDIDIVSSYCQCRGVHPRSFDEAYWSFVEYDPDTYQFTFSEGWADRCPHMIGPLLPERNDVDTMPARGVVIN